MKMNNKSGQEEITGFVLIVVLVSVILVVFLGIYIREQANQPSYKESRELYQFLESVMQYTSDCAVRYEPVYASVNDLIVECFNAPEAVCTNGKKACQVLKDSMDRIIQASWKMNRERYPGYTFHSYYYKNISDQDEEKRDVIKIEVGNCTSSFTAATWPIGQDLGTINNKFSLCYPK